MKGFRRIFFIITVALILGGGFFVWRNFRGAVPALAPPAEDITKLIPAATPKDLLPAKNETGMPLSLPPGFAISILAKNIPEARALIFDAEGNLWVSQRGEGLITKINIKDGVATSQQVMFRNLRNPHGLAFDPEDPSLLYIGETHRISRVRIGSSEPLQKIADLPSAGGGHNTRTLGFGPDGRLYVAIGSSCNVCRENDPQRATILSLNKDGSDLKTYASGLRNTVFFTWDKAGKMWGTEMGRDLLGDDVPPEEINLIREGGFYGWPFCYDNKKQDTAFDGSPEAKNRCETSIPPVVKMQAHSAPLGIGIIPDNWPVEYRGDFLVAFHGSWNRSVPTGYKIVRIIFDENGGSRIEDFISGWRTGSAGALGRPVGIIFDRSSALYISDDSAGVIYKVTYQGAP